MSEVLMVLKFDYFFFHLLTVFKNVFCFFILFNFRKQFGSFPISQQETSNKFRL